MDRFAAANVSFVSVTQNFSTADAMGRLTLNMLMSFAEFEREMIAERTRGPERRAARCHAIGRVRAATALIHSRSSNTKMPRRPVLPDVASTT